MSLSPVEGVALAEAGSGGGETAGPSGGEAIPKAKGIVGRSPGQLAWARLRRDRTAMISGAVLVLFLVVALAAPLIEMLYGIDPNERAMDRLDNHGMPLGYLGGITGEHWFGLEPNTGRDIFIRLVYGLRTSLFIAFTAAIVTAAIGIVTGILAGYLGGWWDSVITWITDLVLAMPFLIIALAVMPTMALRFYGMREEVTITFQVTVLITIFAVFGWTSTARLVRGQVIALREREFVEAARASGAGLGHMLFRQILPNIWAPILVSFSLAVPAYITNEAALSFIGIGLSDESASFGRMIFRSLSYLQTDPAYVFFPGFAIFALVFAFNLFGDSLRDALDPKSSR